MQKQSKNWPGLQYPLKDKKRKVSCDTKYYSLLCVDTITHAKIIHLKRCFMLTNISLYLIQAFTGRCFKMLKKKYTQNKFNFLPSKTPETRISCCFTSDGGLYIFFFTGEGVKMRMGFSGKLCNFFGGEWSPFLNFPRGGG